MALISTKDNAEFEVPKSFVACLGQNETATCLEPFYTDHKRLMTYELTNLGACSHDPGTTHCPGQLTDGSTLPRCMA